MCGSDGGGGFVSLAGLIAAKPCLGDMESGRFEGFRSYQECGYCCCICSKRGCGRGGFAYRVNSTFSKLANPMICFLQMGLGGETPLSAFAVDSGCRCSKRGFWSRWVNAGFLQSVCQLR